MSKYRKLRKSKFIGNDFNRMVSEFHYVTGVRELEKPGFASKEDCDLRIRLIQEELDELRDAIENSDKQETLDALVDLQYVLSGAVAVFGMKDIFQTAFDRVHESNLSKVIIEEEEAIEEVKRYKNELGVMCYYKNVNGFYVLFRTSDNKILKPKSYNKPKLHDLL